MSAYVEQQGIPYPVAVDIDEKTTSAFQVDSYPDYYLIDRAGKLRVADLANGDLDRAVEELLAEPVPEDVAARGESATPTDVTETDAESEVNAARVLEDALTEAGKSERRVLVHLGAPW